MLPLFLLYFSYAYFDRYFNVFFGAVYYFIFKNISCIKDRNFLLYQLQILFSKLLFTFSFSLWYSSPNRSETFEMEIFININFIISTFDFMLRKALLPSRTYKYKKIFSQ